MSELEQEFSRLRDLVEGARRELATGHSNNAVRLIENAQRAAHHLRRLIYNVIDNAEAALANSKAANDGRSDTGIPPKGGD